MTEYFQQKSVFSDWKVPKSVPILWPIRMFDVSQNYKFDFSLHSFTVKLKWRQLKNVPKCTNFRIWSSTRVDTQFSLDLILSRNSRSLSKILNPKRHRHLGIFVKIWVTWFSVSCKKYLFESFIYKILLIKSSIHR